MELAVQPTRGPGRPPKLQPLESRTKLLFAAWLASAHKTTKAKEEFAKKLGISTGYLYQIARGHRQASDSLKKLIEIFSDGAVKESDWPED